MVEFSERHTAYLCVWPFPPALAPSFFASDDPTLKALAKEWDKSHLTSTFPFYCGLLADYIEDHTLPYLSGEVADKMRRVVDKLRKEFNSQ